MNHVTWDLCFWFLLARNNAEEALQKLNGAVIGKQSIRLSWGRNPANKQVNRLLTILKIQNVGDSAYPLMQNLLHHDSFNLDSDLGFQIKMTYELFYWTLLSFVIQAHLSFLFSFFVHWFDSQEQILVISGMEHTMGGRHMMDMGTLFNLKIPTCMLQHMGLILHMGTTNNKWVEGFWFPDKSDLVTGDGHYSIT